VLLRRETGHPLSKAPIEIRHRTLGLVCFAHRKRRLTNTARRVENGGPANRAGFAGQAGITPWARNRALKVKQLKDSEPGADKGESRLGPGAHRR
jgi:hypothetical protein